MLVARSMMIDYRLITPSKTDKTKFRISTKYISIIEKHPNILTELRTITNFITNVLMDNKADVYQRLYCIVNNIIEQPVCKICGSDIIFSIGRKQFAKYCSTVCAGRDDDNRRKYENTMIKKYGVKHPIQHSAIKQQMQNTMQSRYGVDHYVLSTDFAKKSQETCLVKYGVDHYRKTLESKQRYLATCQYRYQTYTPRLQHVSHLVLQQLNNYQLLQSLNETLTLSQIGKQLGVSASMIQKRFQSLGIVPRIHYTSSTQREIEDFLSNDLGLDIKTNVYGLLDNSRHEIDILIPTLNIAIEVDGVYWHSELAGKDKLYHLTKTSNLAERGIRLIHIYDTEWINTKNIVKSRLRAITGVIPNIVYGRSCDNIQMVDNKAAQLFLQGNHIQGSCPSVFNVGLFKDNELLCLMTFGKSRFNINIDFELLRFVTKTNTTVLGGASRLFKYFVKVTNPASIISYSDKRWNTGNLYSRLGFTHTHNSSPNYHYFYKTNTTKLLSRVKFQKHKLSRLLDKFDPNLTEWDNMTNNNYDRIWDCGNAVYTWKR
jgi:hypothetical protein